MDGPFRVAFWGLIAGFGLTVALAVTDPEAMRLALDTPPPAGIDAPEAGTLLADTAPPDPVDATFSEAAVEAAPVVPSIADASPETPLESEPPVFVEVPSVADNRLAMDPERPLIVPPFDAVTRPVPTPPEIHERPIIDAETESGGVPIEVEMEDGEPRIHVVVRPTRNGEFVELPPPVEAELPPAAEPTEPVIARGPLLAPLPPDAFISPQAPRLGQTVADAEPTGDGAPAGGVGELFGTADEPSPAGSITAIDELKAMFETELGSLRSEIESFAANSSLDARMAEILEAQQELDRDRVIHEISLLRTELERMQQAEADAAARQAENAAAAPPPAVVITSSMLQPGKIDVELNSAPAAEAFARLGLEAGLNLLTSETIQGNVTARLQGVVAWEAILALAHSRECEIINDAGYLVVVPKTPPETSPEDGLYSQLLFPSHLAAEEVAAVLQPLLTPGVGRISCTQGDHPQSIAGTQAVLIVDRPGVIERARSILADVDLPPRTLQVTAQIMLVRREGVFRDGVVAAIGQENEVFSPAGAPPQMHCDEAGCCDAATVAMPPDEFCRRLKTIAEVETVASPCLRVLDRHSAEISLADEACRQTLSGAGWRGVDVSGGSSLSVRPMLTRSGMIHLEISPKGNVDVTGRCETETTSGAMATSVLIPSGGSLVIGEVCQDSSLTATGVRGLLQPLRRLLPRGSTGANSTTEFVVVISASIVE